MTKRAKKSKSFAMQDVQLSSRALLIDLDCGAWRGRATDKVVSDDVAKRNKADSRAGRYTKRLLPKGSVFDDVSSALHSTHRLHKQLTLPWKDRGPRILPADQFLEYSKMMRKSIARFDKAVDKFIAEYPQLQRKAKEFLGDLYDADKYKAAETLRSSFYIKMTVFPVPDAGDFRVELPAAQLEQLKKDVAAETQESMTFAMQYLWATVHKAVTLFADRVENGDKSLRQTVFTKLKKACSRIDNLNLVNDTQLAEIKNKIEKELSTYDAETLRDDSKLRSDVAKKARHIEKVMSAFMGK